ncbi:hypothetical protein EVB95_136 [Rhizobium phage RHph_TM2_3B]|nr:hypothetical protein EVB95_136 [Rhizobium phage RHph_TM2_3B]
MEDQKPRLGEIIEDCYLYGHTTLLTGFVVRILEIDGDDVSIEFEDYRDNTINWTIKSNFIKEITDETT